MNFPLLVSRTFCRSFLTKNCHRIRNFNFKTLTDMSKASHRLIWVDLEMTGLDVETCQIIEMACLITDGKLNIVAEGPDLVIHQPDSALEAMDEWCTKHHREIGIKHSNVRANMSIHPECNVWHHLLRIADCINKICLTAAVRASDITLSQAEQTFLDFIKKHTPPKECPLAGNSVHADKKFLDKYMPLFMDHLHYRIVDVSTVKELCRRWYPETYKKAPRKEEQHRALEDIKESITELQFYKQTIFK